MVDGPITKKAQEITLTQLLKEVTPEQVRQRLGTAYDNAVRAAINLMTQGTKEYTAQIREALRTGNTEEAKRVRDSMPEYLDWDTKKGVFIVPGVESGLRSQKKSFVDNTTLVLSSCLFGKGSDEIVKAASISFGRKASLYAQLLAPSLAKQLGMEKPVEESEELIAFDEAKIAKGKLPLVIEAKGDTIMIRYANVAIAPRTQVYEKM